MLLKELKISIKYSYRVFIINELVFFVGTLGNCFYITSIHLNTIYGKYGHKGTLELLLPFWITICILGISLLLDRCRFLIFWCLIHLFISLFQWLSINYTVKEPRGQLEQLFLEVFYSSVFVIFEKVRNYWA